MKRNLTTLDKTRLCAIRDHGASSLEGKDNRHKGEFICTVSIVIWCQGMRQRDLVRGDSLESFELTDKGREASGEYPSWGA